MYHSKDEKDRIAELHAFSHPRYFYGQLLDVRQFDSEQEYFKGKLWLANRLLHGYGVVCGLDVQPGSQPGTVVVKPGVALDTWGREIVVPSDSKLIAIPPVEPEKPGQTQAYRKGECHDQKQWVHLVICFKSCEFDPQPVLAGGCNTPQRCAMGAVRESYSIPPPRSGAAEPPDICGSFHDIFKAKPVDYGALVQWVTRNCNPCLPGGDPCIVLANVRQPRPGGPVEEIDINVRPIVYSLPLLFNLVLSAGTEPPKGRGKGHI